MRAASCTFRARVAGYREDEVVPGYRVLPELCEYVVWNRKAFSPTHLMDMRELANLAQAHLEEMLTGEPARAAGHADCLSVSQIDQQRLSDYGQTSPLAARKPSLVRQCGRLEGKAYPGIDCRRAVVCAMRFVILAARGFHVAVER